MRRAAVVWLADKSTGEAQLLSMVAQYLDPGAPTEVRQSAVQVLAHSGAAAVPFAPRLAALLTDADPAVRRAAFSALRDQPMAAAAAAQLAALLHSPNDPARFYGAALLGDAGPAAAPYAAQVGALLDDSSFEVRIAAAATLSQMGPAGLAYAGKMFPLLGTPLREVVARGFVRMGSVEAAQVPELVKWLSDPSAATRAAAADDLGLLAPLGPAVTGTASEVARLLADSDVRVRTAALRALGRMGPAAAAYAPQITALLAEPDDAAYQAAAALGHLGPAAAAQVPQISALLADPSTAAQAATALGYLGPAAAAQVPRLQALLAAASPGAREAAVLALDRLQAARASAPQIAALVADGHGEVSQAAIHALVDLGPDAAAVAPQVAELLTVNDDFARQAAVQALGAMGKAAAGAAPQIAALLWADPTRYPGTDVSAFKALGAMGPAAAAAAPQLAAYITKGGVLDLDAFEDLGKIGPAAAGVAPQIAPLLKSWNMLDRRAAAGALGAMGPAAAKFAPQLGGLLTDSEPLVRTEAAQALGGMGPAAAPVAAGIAAVMADPASSFRAAALHALDRITAASPLPDRDILFDCLDASRTLQSEADQFLLRAYLYPRNDPEDLVLIRWLGSRGAADRAALSSLDQESARALLRTFSRGWDASQGYPEVRQELAERIADLSRSRAWEVRDVPLLAGLYARLAPGYAAQALVVQAAIDKNEWYQRLHNAGALIAAHIAAWIALIFAYPRLPWVQSLFFWNKWARRFLGAGYVGFAITMVPWLRRRMLLPFQASLLPQAGRAQLNESTYFEGGEVLLEKNRRVEPKRLPLKDTLSGIRGQIVLKGPSGLGKTLLMVRLALAAKEPVVFLRATECTQGVLAAIQRKLQGQMRDEDYLRTLIHSGGLKVLIDGLNEASPDARARITQFVEEQFRGDFILSTQPIGWEPPATVRVYVLQPLQPQQIGPFLLQQWDGVAGRATLTRKQYEAAVGAYVKVLGGSAGTGPEGTPLANPMEAAVAAELIALSNPMDATLAAELLARGQTPNAFGLIEQRYRVMSADFRAREGRDFPLQRFAERVYEWRASGEPDMRIEDFEVEAAALVQERLMLTRSEITHWDTHEQEIHRWFFRHDKIMEFFLLPAFMGDRARREAHSLEERFWGVYDLLAVRLPDQEEEQLQQFLAKQAALTGRNDILGRYTLARRARARSARQPATAGAAVS